MQAETDGFAPGQGKPADFSTSDTAGINLDSSAVPIDTFEETGEVRFHDHSCRICMCLS